MDSDKATPIDVPYGPTGVAVGAGAVWVTSNGHLDDARLGQRSLSVDAVTGVDYDIEEAHDSVPLSAAIRYVRSSSFGGQVVDNAITEPTVVWHKWREAHEGAEV